ncbi:MAG: hypothetical protein N3A71_03655 [Candidatus Dojkabacteria bacterium]|nr:hypothetical protein [Candidatus Dojkabacteria bacterium]
MQKFFTLKNTTFQFVLVLLAFVFYHLVFRIFQDSLWGIFVYDLISKIIVLALVFGIYYFIATKYFNIFVNPLNLMISGILLLAILDVQTNMIYWILIAIFLIIFKAFIRYQGGPIFNPTMASIFGLLVVLDVLSFVFRLQPIDLSVSWWAGNVLKIFDNLFIQYFLAISIALVFVYYAYKFKKIYLSISFIIFATVFKIIDLVSFINTFDLGLSDITRLVVDIFLSMVFFSFVMFNEPKTTPIEVTQQVFYGFVGAFIIFLLQFLPESLSDLHIFYSTEVFITIIVNLIYFLDRYFGVFSRVEKYLKNFYENKN